MPETGDIDKGYGGASSESKGIISILEMLKEDLENEMKEAKADEEAAAAEYAEQRKTAQEGLDALNGKKGHLESRRPEGCQGGGAEGHGPELQLAEEGVRDPA